MQESSTDMCVLQKLYFLKLKYQHILLCFQKKKAKNVLIIYVTMF